MFRHPQNRIKTVGPLQVAGAGCRSPPQVGDAAAGQPTTNSTGCSPRWDIKPQGCKDKNRGSSSLGHWAKQAGAGRRKDPLLPGFSLTPQPLSEHWGIISPFNHKKQICACHQRAERMGTAAQTSMGHTHTEGEKAAEIQILQFLPFLFPVYTEHRRENTTRQFQSI